LSFERTPLEQMAETLSLETDIPILIDAQTIDRDKPARSSISFAATDQSLGKSLRRMLQPHDLDWIIDHEAVLITTAERASYKLRPRIYPVGDLIPPESAIKPDRARGRLAGLADWISSSVQPAAWEAVGGDNRVIPWPHPPALMIDGTQSIHDEVEELLARRRDSLSR
jgi:hypothetical protein